MAINPFTPKEVKAGEPVTAQAWNVIVKAIGALTQYLETSEATGLRVRVTNSDADPRLVRVTATRDDGFTAQAVAPIPPGTEHVFGALPPGAYTLRAEAEGFDPATASVTIPSANTVSLTMAKRGAKMPLIFGATLSTALTTLKSSGINVSRILDVVGRDVAPANPDPEYVDAAVLVQIPAFGEFVAPEATVQLVVAAALQTESAIEMPSLVGLTQSEAQKALESIGLVLGKIVVKQKSAV